MTRNFDWAKIKQPRVAVRALIGVLVAANLAAAVMAFRPFGGSADDCTCMTFCLASCSNQAQPRSRCI